MAKRQTAVPESVGTRVGTLISEKMDQKGVSIRDLAAKVDMTYEHARRIARGEGIPSKFALRAICEFLGISVREAERLATADRIQKKFGSIPLELAGKEPELEPIERVWDQLTDEQKKSAISMIQAWARQNRASRAS